MSSGGTVFLAPKRTEDVPITPEPRPACIGHKPWNEQTPCFLHCSSNLLPSHFPSGLQRENITSALACDIPHFT
jgi:hypothetical protein